MHSKREMFTVVAVAALTVLVCLLLLTVFLLVTLTTPAEGVVYLMALFVVGVLLLLLAWRDKRLRVALGALAVLSIVANLLGFRFPQQLIMAPASSCDKRTLAESSSPDGSHVASVRLWNCGALSPFYLDVGIRKSWDVWGLGSKGIAAVHGTRGDIRWLDNETLLVEYSGEPFAPFTASWDGVTFVYRKMEK